MKLLNQTPGSELFLCVSDAGCVATLSDAVATDGASRIGGWFFVGDDDKKLLPSSSSLLHLAAPSLVVTTTTNDPDLIQAANGNPFVLVISIPGDNNNEVARWQWTSRCLVDFCEAESARRRHGRRAQKRIHAKL
jgi:hypothetical protein